MIDDIKAEVSADKAEIEALIKRQFAALTWHESHPPSTDTLVADCLPDARFAASARPAKTQSPADFAARMAGLHDDGRITTFEERGRGLHIWVTGTVAVALAGCEMHENQDQVTKDISAFMLVKNPEGWAILSQAWTILPSISDAFAALDLDAQAFTQP